MRSREEIQEEIAIYQEEVKSIEFFVNYWKKLCKNYGDNIKDGTLEYFEYGLLDNLKANLERVEQELKEL